MKKSTILFSLFFFVCQCFSQQNMADSLITSLKTAKEDTNKVNILNELSKEIGWKIGDYDTAYYFAESANKLAEKLKFKKGISIATKNKGNAFFFQGDYSNSIVNYKLSQAVCQEIGDKTGEASAFHNLGNVYDAQGNYPEALKSHFASLKIKDALKDSKGIANSYSNIGTIYTKQGSYEDALSAQNKALNLREELGDKYGAALCRNNIGIVYQYQSKFKEALENYEISLKIFEEFGDVNSAAAAYGNIGNIYKDQGKFAEAIKYFAKTLEIKEKIGDKYGISIAFIDIGNVNYSLKNFNVAREDFNKGLTIAKEIGVKDNIKISYLMLSTLDSIQGNAKGALENYKRYIIYKDSIDNELTKENTMKEKLTYEFEKKELIAQAEQENKDALALVEQSRKDSIAEAELQQHKLQRNYFIIGFGLVILLAIFIFRSYKRQQKATILITEQKNLVENQKHIIEEKHREITDSINYAERIQRSFLASKEMLDEHLKDYFVFFKPKDVVSGDFYWAAELNDGNFAFTVADSTGHGVPGAIMSLLNITSLEKSIETASEPHTILNKTRQIIINRLKKDGSVSGGKDGMDCNLVVLNKDKTILTFASANNPVIIVRNGEIIEYKGDKMPVGKHDKENEPFTLNSVKLQKGDVVYTLTDGFPDQFGGPKGKKYMIKNLKEKFLQISSLPMEQQEIELDIEFNTWKSENEQIDDVCIIGVRI